MTSVPFLSSSKVDQMMTMRGSFSFGHDNKFEITLDDGVILRVERVGCGIARVYFVDEDSFSEVPIPEGLVIYDMNNSVAVTPPASTVQFFVLSWTDNYSIRFNGEVIAELVSQRQWSLRGSPDWFSVLIV